MKKTLLFLSVASLSVAFSFAQAPQHRCGTMEHLEYLKQQDPGLEARMQAMEVQTQEYVNANPNARMQVVTTIPVIVHVVYNTTAQNISDDMIKSQIDVLNEDFGAYNSDVAKVPPFFKARVADTQIRFALATRDPSGNPHNGIRRVSTTVSSFSSNNAVKHTSQGGDDAWSNASYMNIWVCNLGSGLLGYAQFPCTGSAADDGVVILYTSFGRISAGGPYHYGRTTTHEVGHWLNLRHIWGDSNCGNDLVSDTPTSQGSNFGSYTCANVTCNNGPTGDMFMNYMDYTDDRYMYMFTTGQTVRITSTMNGCRSALASSLGLTNPAPVAVDAGISDIITPRFVILSDANNDFIPEVVLKNYGTSTLTSCDIVYKVDALAAATYNWTGSLASGSTVNIVLPQVAVPASAADRIFYCNTSNPNGGTDGFTINDKLQTNFIGKVAHQAAPLVQSFDALPFPPTGWSNKNYTCGTTYARVTTTSHSGAGCVKFDNFANTVNGKTNDLFTPPLNLTVTANPEISFWVAYAPESATSFDTLEVLISTNGGLSYTSLYKKWGSTLATVAAQTSAFTPASANDWRQETINLAAYNTWQDAIVIFRNISRTANNLYIDDLNFTTGISKVENLSHFSVFPNPSIGIVMLNAKFTIQENIEVRIFNMLGAEVYSEKFAGDEINAQFDLHNLAAGIYNLALVSSQGVVTKKITIEK